MVLLGARRHPARLRFGGVLAGKFLDRDVEALFWILAGTGSVWLLVALLGFLLAVGRVAEATRVRGIFP